MHEIHDCRSRNLTAEQVRRALDVDVPSDSDDNRFDISDDSDRDPDYENPAAPAVEDSSDEEQDEELPELNEPDPLVPISAQGASQPAGGQDNRSKVPGRPAKKPRAEWTWSDDDIPFRPSPEHKFTVKGTFSVYFTI
jgi:hypothetical protein